MCESGRKNKNGKYLKEMQRFAEDLKKSNGKARKFLIKAGICTPKGNLTHNYK